MWWILRRARLTGASLFSQASSTTNNNTPKTGERCHVVSKHKVDFEVTFCLVEWWMYQLIDFDALLLPKKLSALHNLNILKYLHHKYWNVRYWRQEMPKAFLWLNNLLFNELTSSKDKMSNYPSNTINYIHNARPVFPKGVERARQILR